MKKMTLILRIGIFIITMSCVGPAFAKLYPEGTPTRAIQDLDTLLDGYVVSPKTEEEKAHNRRLKKQALHGTFDIRELARISLDKHWKELTPKEQNHFVYVLSSLLERKAVFAKEQGGGKKKGTQYGITYKGHKFVKKNEQAFVRSWVRIPRENLKISLNYRVHLKGSFQNQPRDPIFGRPLPPAQGSTNSKEWKIYDVIVDEASLVDNYRYQFDSIIRKGGYEDLIRRMESKLQEMMDKEKSS